MGEYVGRVSRAPGSYGRPAAVAVDANGICHQVPPYTQPGTLGDGLRDLYDGARRVFGALKELPGIFYMGKVHGVKHKAKQGNWTERDPNSRKAKLNGNTGKKVKK